MAVYRQLYKLLEMGLINLVEIPTLKYHGNRQIFQISRKGNQLISQSE